MTATEQATARAFNGTHPIGTPVRYWTGARKGNGKTARTRTNAQLLGGHTAVVWLNGVSSCIALTHIEPISEDELVDYDPDHDHILNQPPAIQTVILPGVSR